MSHVGISLRAEVQDWEVLLRLGAGSWWVAVNVGDLGCGTLCPINRGVKNGEVQHVCECVCKELLLERGGDI